MIGSGDPYLTIERFWLLLDNLRARGIKTIDGDIILDRSSFQVPAHDPFAFDGEGNRPYNLGPDALLINSRSLIIRFRPDPKKGLLIFIPNLTLKASSFLKVFRSAKKYAEPGESKLTRTTPILTIRSSRVNILPAAVLKI